MTVTADAKRRVVLPSVNPGDSFKVEQNGSEIRLLLLKPVESKAGKPSKVRMLKKDGYTVGELDHPIDMAALQLALDEFP
jgi:hypothetical protein